MTTTAPGGNSAGVPDATTAVVTLCAGDALRQALASLPPQQITDCLQIPTRGPLTICAREALLETTARRLRHAF